MALPDAELDRSVLDALRELPSPDGRSMVACVAELFANDAPPLMLQMQQAAEHADWAALAAAAHALKSYAGNVGALSFMADLRALECAAKNGEGAVCQQLLHSLPAACNAVANALVEASVEPSRSEAACP